MTVEFQRARSPAQQELRRAAIVAAARSLLDEGQLADISLRELSRAVGLSKSNVVRYFPTREAVFLTVLVDDWRLWLDDVERRLAAPTRKRRVDSRSVEVAHALAGSLVEHQRYCDLLASCPSVLERNVPVEAAREFKLAALNLLGRLATIVRRRLPEIGEAAAFEFAGILWALVAGAWPMANPAPSVATVLLEPSLAAMCVDFEPAIGRAAALVLTGLASGAPTTSSTASDRRQS